MEQLSFLDDLFPKPREWNNYTVISRVKVMKKVHKWIKENHNEYNLNGFWLFLTKSEHQTGNSVVYFGTTHEKFTFPDGKIASNIVDKSHYLYFVPDAAPDDYIDEVKEILKGWQNETR